MHLTVSIDPQGENAKRITSSTKEKNRNQNLVEKALIVVLDMLMKERLQLIDVNPKSRWEIMGTLYLIPMVFLIKFDTPFVVWS
jgi:hypothetical protein